MNQTHPTIKIAAAFGLTGVLAGAFGAHALDNILTVHEMDWWKTANFYHIVHSLLLVGIALSLTRTSSIWMYRAFSTTAMGIILFSGSLYIMALTSVRWIALLTPIGGVSLSLGWICLFMVSKNLFPTKNKDKGNE